MTLRALPRSRLDRLVPPLVRDGALIALVPATDDTRWAAETAWSVARAAAAGSQGKRRAVALVDLCLDAPYLHLARQLAPTPGIVDAFSSEGPLSDVARDVDGVHFLPAGTPTRDRSGVLATARWRRLQAGFRSEGALLLVCLPAEALPDLGADPDGVLALAPGGVDLGTAQGRALLAARERGIDLLGVVRERWSAPTPAFRPARRRVASPQLLAFAAVAAIVGTVVLSSSDGALSGPGAGSRPEVNRVSFGTAQVPVLVEPAATPDPALPVLARADSGGWTLQLAAYGAPERAQGHVDRVASAGLAAFVSPLAPDASGAVWYRVLAGAYTDRKAATAARASLWQRGVAARGEGKPLFAPYSLVLAHPADAGRLRAAGLAGIRWGTRNAVLVGAFEHPEQASIAAAQLQRVGIATTLVTRTDRTP